MCGWLKEIADRDAMMCADCSKVADDLGKLANELLGSGELVDITKQTRAAWAEYTRTKRVYIPPADNKELRKP